MAYELCKMQIENKKGEDKAYMMSCLVCFLMTKQITQEQYIELINMLNPVPTPTPTTPTQPTGTVTPAPTVQGQPQQ